MLCPNFCNFCGLKVILRSVNHFAMASHENMLNMLSPAKKLEDVESEASKQDKELAIKLEELKLEKDRGASIAAAIAAIKPIEHKNVYFKISEKLVAEINRDEGSETAEIRGSMSINVSDNQIQIYALHVDNQIQSEAEIHIDPYLDELAWQRQSILKLDSKDQPFPFYHDGELLSWELQFEEESLLPFTLYIKPKKTAKSCTVRIHYELQRVEMILKNVEISFPVTYVLITMTDKSKDLFFLPKKSEDLFDTVS
ncbi:Coatomer subunit delta [Aphelenchoides besseyi]|nr:Coatomer subunit delta [Aphelenchoides besseyi]